MMKDNSNARAGLSLESEQMMVGVFNKLRKKIYRFVTKYNVHNPYRIVNFVQYLKTFELQTF